MANIIDAILNMVNDPKYELLNYSNSHNRANNMGEALEEYVKDIFAGTVGERDANVRNRKFASVFSYLGNQNNPPDSMLKGGDAIEVKKIESNDAALALNSSYPKYKLFANSPMISAACRSCERWVEKDMIYVVGCVDRSRIKSLCMVYGVDYCANAAVYERIKGVIKSGVESIQGVEFAETRELGRVNRVDPLGITYLRVRGMWGIENPFTVFNYLYRRNHSNRFNFMCLINDAKWKSLPNTSSLTGLVGKVKGLEVKDVKFKDPNNPAVLKDGHLITYTVR